MPEYLKRAAPQPDAITQGVRDTVSEILLAVQREGEPAVRRYPSARRLVAAVVPRRHGPGARRRACATTSTIPSTQVRGFAAAQRATLQDLEVETLPGRRRSATATSRSTPSAPTRRAASTR